jgi:hypothetical protein
MKDEKGNDKKKKKPINPDAGTKGDEQRPKKPPVG